MSAVALDLPAETVQPWELHSELVLVCPEVHTRALELLPERDPDAFLDRPRRPAAVSRARVHESEPTPGISAAVAGYALWRLAETARTALYAVVCLVALASLVELMH